LLTYSKHVVNIGSISRPSGLCRVSRDEVSIGRMAARHLMDCGLTSFGYFGSSWGDPSEGREIGFRHMLRDFFHEALVCYVGSRKAAGSSGGFASSKQVRQWLDRLHKPSGVFAANDTWAIWLCEACHMAGIHVPEDIAIVGADNDELLCELGHPPISSVAVPSARIGHEAAALLDRLMSHEDAPDTPILLPASGVVARRSTDILAGVEPVVSKAVRFIREHISDPIEVSDVLRHVRRPRRSLERRFHKAIGRSLAQEIRRSRVALAKALLTGNTQMKTASIAGRCGFSSTPQFFTVFRQATGMTPTDYRNAIDQDGKQEYSFADSSDKHPAGKKA
jgi:LacI family transcriptional regulator